MNFYKTLLLVCLCLPMVTFANPYDKYIRNKKINKTFTVNKDASVHIENSFGDVTIIIWDQNSVSIDVTVEVTGNDEESVNKRLEMIDVDFKASTSRVSAVSDIPSENSGIMSWLNSRKSTNTSVDYIVKIPRNSPLNVDNDYGAIIIERLLAPLDLSCDFGRLEIGQLLHTNNSLSFDYTDHSHIDYMKAGTIKADFSKFKIYGADDVDFSGDYTTIELGPLKNIKYNSDFSKINIQEAISIDGRGDYSTVKIGTVKKDAVLKADFGSIEVSNLKNGFSNVNVKSDYTSVSIGYDNSASFDFECQTEFGSLKTGRSLTVTSSKKEMNENYKQGYQNRQGSNSKIAINSSFGSVTLESND